MRRPPWLAWVVVACAGVVLLGACVPTGGSELGFRPGEAPAQALPRPGELAPTSLAAFEGMLTGAQGRPVVVNVWASWCAPCRVEAPLLQRAAERYGTEVIFVGVDSRDDRDAGAAFMRRYGMTYPNVFDDTGAIRQALGLRGFPTTYIFGRDGRLRSTVVGGISEQVLAARLADARRA